MPPKPAADRPYSQREVYNHVMARLGAGQHSWIQDPGGAANTVAYGSRSWPSQLIYLIYKPSTLDLRLIFTPRRISLTREAELWTAADQLRPTLRRNGVSARRQTGNTEETERDAQYAVNVPAEGITEEAFDALNDFLSLVAECVGVLEQ